MGAETSDDPPNAPPIVDRDGGLFQPLFPEDWPRRPLWDTAIWVNGLPFRDISFSAVGDPIIKIAELKAGVSSNTKRTRQSFDPKYRVVAGDVLYSWSGSPETSLDVFVWSGSPGWLNQHIFKINVADGVDGGFHIQLLRYLRPNLVAIATNKQTTGLGHVTQQDLRRLVVGLPPIQQQRAIAHILGTLDAKIELNRHTNETLEAMARALFKSWFVDFDPVRMKAAGKMPSGMDAETAALFPSEFVESEMGEIPKGWSCRSLSEWASTLSGGTPAKDTPAYWGGAIPWISPKAMMSLHADASDETVTEQALGNGTRLAPLGSCLVMVRGMGLHEEVRVSQARREVAFNQDVKALVPRGIQPSLLLFAMLNGQEDLLLRVESSGHGTGRLPSDILLSHPITMPPIEAQARLGAHFDAMNSRIDSARKETMTLAAARDALLPRLLSGELRIPDAERIVGAAT